LCVKLLVRWTSDSNAHTDIISIICAVYLYQTFFYGIFDLPMDPRQVEIFFVFPVQFVNAATNAATSQLSDLEIEFPDVMRTK